MDKQNVMCMQNGMVLALKKDGYADTGAKLDEP